MFERRLKIFLALLVGVTCVLVLRAAHVQVVQKDQWVARAEEAARRSQTIDTTRGRILDFKGRPIAFDQPCIDACIDFRALARPGEDPASKASQDKWTYAVAVERVKARLRDAYAQTPRPKRAELIKAEQEQVRADIDAMWGRLAKISGRAPEEIEQARAEIVNKVKLRRRYVWYRNYQVAVKRFEEREPTPAWRRWLVDESAEAPQEDQFTNLVVAEELADHAVLKAVSVDVQNELRKHIEQYPGLTLRPGVQRFYPYPYGEAGCHLIGQLARVNREDLDADPNVGKDDPRRYYPNDLIGRSGLEKLAEPVLRGSRGRVDTVEGRDGEVGRVEPVGGRDVRTTIDMDLQYDVLSMFQNAKIVYDVPGPTPEARKIQKTDIVDMHGGAVVIDIPTGEVRALASNPTFDLNEFQDRYAQLASDELNFPMVNRATQVARTPGSTIKPVVGLAGIAEGEVGLHQGIECTGFLVINGRRIPNGRCWTQSMFGSLGLGMHHQIPSGDPHVGTHGNATGFLTYEDAVQRSCNVYFETLGDKLKMEGMSDWFDRFGLGRRAGLGISEAPGTLPDRFRGPLHERRFATWIAAIGQGDTLATPLQMANVAATIARDGTWVRPRLLVGGQGVDVPLPADAGPDRVDLGLPPAAVRAAREGMKRVVNTPAGSAYPYFRKAQVTLAGKTGTAEEGARLRVKVRDEDGNVVLDKDNPDPAKRDRPLTRLIEPSAPGRYNTEAPWYRGFGPEGTDLKHSWFIGFAPADNPTVAFAIMLEYGGSGGGGAGRIANDLVAALVERQYLDRDPNAPGAKARTASEVIPAEPPARPHVGD